MEYKEKDVFKFKFNEEYLKKHNYPYHCFDGQLIVHKRQDGTLIFKDTYYSNSTYFTLEELEKVGTLEFVCNLDDVVDCSEYDKVYYDENDIINLSYQHNSYKWFVRKKDAKRSKEKMMETIKNKIEEKEREIRWLEDEIKRLKEKQERIENGEDISKITI